MAGWLRARQTKYAAYATTYILVVLTIVVVINVLANRYNKSWDSTADKRYTLSDQTAKVVNDLKQNVTIKYYDQTSHFPAAQDLLDRYTNLSTRVHVQYLDPDKDPTTARAAGVTSYGTTIVEIGDKKETAKSVTEEDITGAFIRALKDKTRTVCFLAGSGEHGFDDTDRNGYSHFVDMLKQDNYAAKSISLLQQADIPADCTVTVIGGPTTDYQPSAVDQVKKYVEGGGRALLLLDPPLKMGKPVIADNDGLASLLATWGATLDKDLILDLNPIGQMAGLGPQVALVTTYSSHPIVDQMKGTATGFPLSRSMQTKNMDQTVVQQLFSSSDSSLATTKLNSPSVNPQDPANKKGPMPIAAAGTYSPADKPDVQGRFVVVGSSGWVANSFLSFDGNGDLAMNMMNWLSSDEDLISIRPKPPENGQVTMTNGQMSLVRITSQFMLPLIVVFAGVTVWWKRR